MFFYGGQMAREKDHAADCKRYLGKPYSKVHRFLDQYAGVFPSNSSYLDYHRTFLHNSYGIEIIKAKWGYEAMLAGLIHLYRDYYEGPVKYLSLDIILKRIPQSMLFFNSLANEYLPEPYVIRKWEKESLCSLAFRLYQRRNKK